MGKLTFIAGLAAGYVLGARAGRQRYEQIRRTSGKVWNSGPVQKQVLDGQGGRPHQGRPGRRRHGRRRRPRDRREAALEPHGGRRRPSRPASAAPGRPTAPSPTGSGADPWAAATRAPTAPPEPLRPGGSQSGQDPCARRSARHTGHAGLQRPLRRRAGVAGSPCRGTVVPCTAPPRPGAVTPLGSDVGKEGVGAPVIPVPLKCARRRYQRLPWALLFSADDHHYSEPDG